MPGWFIDFGRYAGGLVVFGLCALLSSVALVPCVYLFSALQAATSTTWAVLLVPFLYGVWGTCLCALCVLMKTLLRYHPKRGEWELFSFAGVGWGIAGALTNWVNIFFL